MASSKEFDEFVKREQQRAQQRDNKAPDWALELKIWLDSLDRLHAIIRSFLEDYISNGSIQLRFEPIEMNEKNVGAYTANKLFIKIGGEEIEFKPIGTMLIGSRGRVDVIGSRDSTRLVLIPKDITSPSQVLKFSFTVNGQPNQTPKPEEPKKPAEIVWKIVSRPPRMRFTELDKESLMQMLLDVSNG